eukprot:Platyproteum_vivax@DN13762_c0_g1_i1.p1
MSHLALVSQGSSQLLFFNNHCCSRLDLSSTTTTKKKAKSVSFFFDASSFGGWKIIKERGMFTEERRTQVPSLKETGQKAFYTELKLLKDLKKIAINRNV